MNSVQDYRSQLIARQNTYLRFCFVVSIAGHVGLVAIAAVWFQKPASAPESVDREPIEYVVIDTPEAEPPLDPQRRANINSVAGGQRIPDLPTNTEQSSRVTRLLRDMEEPGSILSSLDENTAIRDNFEPSQPSSSAGQTSPSPAQSAEQPTSPEVVNPLNQPESNPELSRRSPANFLTNPTVPSSPRSIPPDPDSSMSQSLASPTSPTSDSLIPQPLSRSADTYSTSAADLLPDNASHVLVAQRNDQLFNPNQTVAARGIDATKDDIWGAYMARLRQSIVGRWRLIQIDQTRRTRVQFTINRQGALVGNVRLTQSSGFRAADEAALQAIQSAAPFGPFPNGTDKTSLTISFTFNYTLR